MYALLSKVFSIATWLPSAPTANVMCRKFETNIPRNETAQPRSSFYFHVSVSDLYVYIYPSISKHNTAK
jgi:hypothetical protein